MSSFNWPPIGSSGGVPTYASFAALPIGASNGDAAITLDTHSLYIYDTGTATWIIAGGPVAVLAIGTIDSRPKSANGGVDYANALILQTADASFPGVVSIGTQTFAGNKTFTGSITASNLSGTNTGDVTLGTASGLSLVGQVLSLQLADATHTGALLNTDWVLFNSKEPAIAAGTTLQYFRGDKTFQTLDTLAVPENTNLYFTQARARGAISATSPILYNAATGVISEIVADATHDGYLLQTDWNIFNNKQSALTFGSISTSTGGVTIGSGANSTVGPNVTVDIATASASLTGLISSTDWNTFNNKQPAGAYITALTGDVTASGPGAAPATLASVGTAGTYVKVTTDIKGRVTSGSASPLGISDGGTGQVTASTAFNALSPLTTKGDLLVYSTTNTREPVGADGQVLVADSAQTTGVKWINNPASSVPTMQIFTSGSGTYTTPANTRYIRVIMVGGGSGGAGGGVSGSAGAGGAGTDTTFSTLTAGGGGATSTAGAYGGSGGAASLGVGPIGVALTGAAGGGSEFNATGACNLAGGAGGSSPFGGAGNTTGASGGTAAAANSGSGGGGAGQNATATTYSGAGGGSGGYVNAIISSLSATYSYAVGAGGAGGTAGTSGTAGGAGGDGIIIVEEFY